MRTDFETAQRRYAEDSHLQQGKPCPWGDYDFYRLLDGIFNVKSMNAALAEENRSIGGCVKGDLFRFVVICSRHIEESGKARECGDRLGGCWDPFRNLIEKMYSEGESWSDTLASSTIRLLFIAAVIFNLPENCKLENIVSSPDARRISGSYWADVEDVEFCKTLPCDLDGSFKTKSDALMSLEKNLHFHLSKIDR